MELFLVEAALLERQLIILKSPLRCSRLGWSTACVSKSASSSFSAQKTTSLPLHPFCSRTSEKDRWIALVLNITTAACIIFDSHFLNFIPGRCRNHFYWISTGLSGAEGDGEQAATGSCGVCRPVALPPAFLTQPRLVFWHSHLTVECTLQFPGALLDKYGKNAGPMSCTTMVLRSV